MKMELSLEEAHLVDLFRRMDRRGKDVIMRTAEAFSVPVVPFPTWKTHNEEEEITQ